MAATVSFYRKSVLMSFSFEIILLSNFHSQKSTNFALVLLGQKHMLYNAAMHASGFC